VTDIAGAVGIRSRWKTYPVTWVRTSCVWVTFLLGLAVYAVALFPDTVFLRFEARSPYEIGLEGKWLRYLLPAGALTLPALILLAMVFLLLREKLRCAPLTRKKVVTGLWATIGLILSTAPNAASWTWTVQWALGSLGVALVLFSLRQILSVHPALATGLSSILERRPYRKITGAVSVGVCLSLFIVIWVATCRDATLESRTKPLTELGREYLGLTHFALAVADLTSRDETWALSTPGENVVSAAGKILDARFEFGLVLGFIQILLLYFAARAVSGRRAANFAVALYLFSGFAFVASDGALRLRIFSIAVSLVIFCGAHRYRNPLVRAGGSALAFIVGLTVKPFGWIAVAVPALLSQLGSRRAKLMFAAAGGGAVLLAYVSARLSNSGGISDDATLIQHFWQLLSPIGNEFVQRLIWNLNALNKDLLPLPLPALCFVGLLVGSGLANRRERALLLSSLGGAIAFSAAVSLGADALAPSWLYLTEIPLLTLSASGASRAVHLLADVFAPARYRYETKVDYCIIVLSILLGTGLLPRVL